MQFGLTKCRVNLYLNSYTYGCCNMFNSVVGMSTIGAQCIHNNAIRAFNNYSSKFSTNADTHKNCCKLTPCTALNWFRSYLSSNSIITSQTVNLTGSNRFKTILLVLLLRLLNPLIRPNLWNGRRPIMVIGQGMIL